MRSNAAVVVVAVIAVVVAAVASYASSVTAPFLTYDDPYYVLDNARVHAEGFAGLLALWDPRDALAGHELEWFPLRDSVYFALWHAFGAVATPYHVVTLAGHAVCALLVGWLALRLGLAREIAFTAALIFAVHPLHIESVAWVSALKDPMYCSFLVASLIAWLAHRETGRASLYALSMALLACSLLCKSLGIVAPALFVVVELTRDQRLPWRRLALRLLLPTLLCAVAALFFVRVGHANRVVLGPYGGTWPSHYAVMAWAYARYVSQVLLPTNFSIQYCFIVAGPGVAWRGVLGAACIAAYAAVVVVAWRKKWKLATLLLLWFPISLLPVMNIVPFPAIMADRYTYGPSIAVCIAIAWLLGRVAGRTRVVVTAAAVLVLGSVTALRASMWHDEVVLWRTVLDDDICVADPGPWVNVGFGLEKRDPREALDALHHAMNLPDFASWEIERRCMVHARAAMLALKLDDTALAKRHMAAVPNCPSMPFVDNAAAEVAHRTGDVLAELAAAERAVNTDSDPGLVWNRGLARLRAGRLDDGAADVNAVLQAKPAVFCPLARAAIGGGDLGPDARARVEAALAACPPP